MSETNKRIKIEMTEGKSNTTPQASLYWVNEFFRKSGLSGVVNEVIGARKERGAKDSDHIMAMTMSQICGSETIEDQKNLPCRAGILGMTIPSVSATREYMKVFHNEGEDVHRGMGCSYIPEENKYLAGFARIHAHLFRTAHKLRPLDTITLDQDATFIPTTRPDACFNYHKERSYEAFNTYCPEYDMMVATRYSDGNVNPGFRQLAELERVLSYMPEGVKKVKFRSDSAGYQLEVMKYCAREDNKRFGVIDFAISCNVCEEFRDAVSRVEEKSWRLLREKKSDAPRQEWAEVAYASNKLSSSKKLPDIRFYAIHEVLEKKPMKRGKATHDVGIQKIIFPEEVIKELEARSEDMKTLHLTVMSGKIYKVFGMASNILNKPGDELILWHRGRCGRSEQAHDILKNDFGGGHVPSHLFGVNAAWWNIAVLAMNVNSILKGFFLPSGFERCRTKTLRNVFYTLSGKIVKHARKTVLKIWSQDRGSKMLMHALSELDRLLPCMT
jgi:hypothetical protein